jgi:hypothetical protein
VIREAFATDLLRAPPLPDGMDELDPIGVDHTYAMIACRAPGWRIRDSGPNCLKTTPISSYQGKRACESVCRYTQGQGKAQYGPQRPE